MEAGMPNGVVTQLMFVGTAEAAMTLYVSLFNGSVTAVQKYGPGELGTSLRSQPGRRRRPPRPSRQQLEWRR
jgi:hypothetical protein